MRSLDREHCARSVMFMLAVAFLVLIVGLRETLLRKPEVVGGDEVMHVCVSLIHDHTV